MDKEKSKEIVNAMREYMEGMCDFLDLPEKECRDEARKWYEHLKEAIED